MDQDKTLKVNWKEWREYHLLNPSGHSMHDIIQFWRHSTVSRFYFKSTILLLLRILDIVVFKASKSVYFSWNWNLEVLASVMGGTW